MAMLAEMKVGPNVQDGQLKSYRVLLDVCSQVLLICEDQINRYDRPYGTNLANIARKIKSSAKHLAITDTRPCSMLYNIGLEFGESDGESMSAGLSLLFIKMSDELMLAGEITFSNLVTILSNSVEYTEKLGWNDKILLFGIKPYSDSLMRLSKENSMTFCLGEAASAAESAASRSNGTGVPDSGAHAVGVFTRAIHESMKTCLP